MKIKANYAKSLSAACLLTCLPVTLVFGVPQYNVNDLGSLGGTFNQGLGVNNAGIAVGYSHLPNNLSNHAIVGDGISAPIDLGTLGGTHSEAYGINNLGSVVGSSWLSGDALYHGFKWIGPGAPPLTPLTDLNALVNPGYSRALSINDIGQSAGFSLTSGGTEHAVRWSATGVITDLGTLNTGNTGNSYGVAINPAGAVVGYSSLSTSKFTHGALWNTNGTKVDLGTLGGNHSAAYAINVNNEITGSSTTISDAAQHAFFWRANQTPNAMLDLGTLGGTFSEGNGIDNAGNVVGYSTTANNVSSHAFLWQNGIGIQDLNSLIDPASGWVLLEARSISQDGNYIAGTGTLNGQRHAFLLTHIIVDNTPPVVSFTLAPAAPNATGWYIVSPSLTWSVTDPETAISTRVGCTDVVAIPNTAQAGQSFSCSATSIGGASTPVVTPVIKVDTLAPVLTGIPVAFTQQATSTTGAVVSYSLPTASDANSGVKAPGVSCLPASGTAFPMGPTTVDCSATDNAGNTTTASFVVTVADLTPPNVVFNINPTAPSASGWYLVAPSTSWTVTDAESAISSRTACFTVAAQGNTNGAGRNIPCTATSNGGTTGPIVHNIKVDTAKPTLKGVPANITQTATGTAGAVVTYASPVAADPTPGSGLNGAVSCLPASGSTFTVGVTTVNCSVNDIAGNNTTASFTVTVNPADSTPPDVTFQIAPAAPNASGWYTASPSVTWAVTDPQSAITSAPCANVVSIGNTLGQTFSCSATSTGGTTGPVTTPIIKVDTTVPTFTGVPLASTVAATGAAGALVNYIAPTAADTFSGVSAAGVTCLPSSGSTLPIGANTIACSARDNAGNSSSVSWVVTVTDQTPPVVNFQIAPAAPNASGWYKTSPSVTWLVTDPESAITSAPCANVASVGSTLGQSFSCSATSKGGTTGPVTTPVIKVDTTVPTFTGVPLASTVAATGAVGAVINYITPTAADTFSGVSVAGVTCSPSSGSTLPLGNNTITCSASDIAGNTGSVSWIVSVADQTPPVFSSCPATVTITQGQALPLLTATDNISTPVVTRNPAGTLGLGTTAVTWTATDGAGLTATCLQQVTVNAAVTETISVTRSQCKRINATSGEWLVQGTSSIRTNNTIQLYSTATVPLDKTLNKLGPALPVSAQGAWQYQAKPGPACISPTSLRSSATGKENGGITVIIQ